MNNAYTTVSDSNDTMVSDARYAPAAHRKDGVTKNGIPICMLWDDKQVEIVDCSNGRFFMEPLTFDAQAMDLALRVWARLVG